MPFLSTSVHDDRVIACECNIVSTSNDTRNGSELSDHGGQAGTDSFLVVPFDPINQKGDDHHGHGNGTGLDPFSVVIQNKVIYEK